MEEHLNLNYKPFFENLTKDEFKSLIKLHTDYKKGKRKIKPKVIKKLDFIYFPEGEEQ